MDFFNAHYLFASLIWSSVGFGYWIYGKRQTSLSAMLGGAVLIAASWLIISALWMSLVCLATMALAFWFAKLGY